MVNCFISWRISNSVTSHDIVHSSYHIFLQAMLMGRGKKMSQHNLNISNWLKSKQFGQSSSQLRWCYREDCFQTMWQVTVSFLNMYQSRGTTLIIPGHQFFPSVLDAIIAWQILNSLHGDFLSQTLTWSWLHISRSEAFPS